MASENFKITPSVRHPSNLDPAAEMLNGRSHEPFSIFKVKGGFMFCQQGFAGVDLHSNEASAREAALKASPLISCLAKFNASELLACEITIREGLKLVSDLEGSPVECPVTVEQAEAI